MKIKKIGHCCFVAEINGKRVMTDPGAFSTAQVEEQNINLVLFTHEHADHLHLESLQKVLENNPECKIITNSAVGKILEENNIKYIKVAGGENYNFEGISISGFGGKHAEIYGEYGQVENTGYMIDALCYPGDAFENPDAPVDILALPVAGPWMRAKDGIDYAKLIKPRVAFPVHDAILAPIAVFVSKLFSHFLQESGINFKVLELGKEEEL